MINITIIKNKQNIMTIEATGHSGYAESGSDIVCSAVSALTQNLAQGLKEVLKIEPKVVIDEGIPHISIALPEDLSNEKMQETQILMQSTYLGLKDCRDSFNKFIKIKEKLL